MRITALLVCILLVVSLVNGQNTARLVKLAEAVAFGGVCLDGSPPAFYFQEGTGTGANKWQIHHEGGGWCTSLADCYGRSQGALGSSNSYAASINLPFGYLSNNPATNPLMYNWNKVYLKYCDGGSFSGNNETVSEYNGHKLYFRGFRNLHAYLTALMRDHNLGKATDVVIGGCSAGGLATYLHVDWWRAALPASTKVVGLPDSGFFLDYDAPSGRPKYATDMRWVFTQMNSTEGVNEACIAAQRGTEYKCFFAEHTAPHIRTPILPLQSEYDSWQANNILGSTDAAQVNMFGELLTNRFKMNVLAASKNGGFLDSCFHHCDGWGPIKINGENSATVFGRWYGGGNGVALQQQRYPCTACCA